MYRMCGWYMITGNLILCYFFFSIAPFAPLLKYTWYMWNRQGALKSHRISSSLCSHDSALLYLYWYLYFMLILPWCILYYIWWEAIKLFWIWIWIWVPIMYIIKGQARYIVNLWSLIPHTQPVTKPENAHKKVKFLQKSSMARIVKDNAQRH